MCKCVRTHAHAHAQICGSKNSWFLTLYSGFVLPIMSCLVIIDFVGTRHSQWHTHTFLYMSSSLFLFVVLFPFSINFKSNVDAWWKIRCFHYLQIYDVRMQLCRKMHFFEKKTKRILISISNSRIKYTMTKYGWSMRLTIANFSVRKVFYINDKSSPNFRSCIQIQKK